MFRNYAKEKPKAASSKPKTALKASTTKAKTQNPKSEEKSSGKHMSVFAKVIEMERKASQGTAGPGTRRVSIVAKLEPRIPKNPNEFPDPKHIGRNISEEFFTLESLLYQGFMTGKLSKNQISLQYTRNTRALREYLEDLWLHNSSFEASKGDKGITEEELTEAFYHWTRSVSKEIQKDSDKMITDLYGPKEKASKKKKRTT